MNKRIYKVTVQLPTNQEDPDLVLLISAVSANQAVRHASRNTIKASVATQAELVQLTKEGIEVQDSTIPVKE